MLTVNKGADHIGGQGYDCRTAGPNCASHSNAIITAQGNEPLNNRAPTPSTPTTPSSDSSSDRPPSPPPNSKGTKRQREDDNGGGGSVQKRPTTRSQTTTANCGTGIAKRSGEACALPTRANTATKPATKIDLPKSNHESKSPKSNSNTAANPQAVPKSKSVPVQKSQGAATIPGKSGAQSPSVKTKPSSGSAARRPGTSYAQAAGGGKAASQKETKATVGQQSTVQAPAKLPVAVKPQTTIQSQAPVKLKTPTKKGG